MKATNYLYTILITGVLLSLSACDDYLDINADPNNPTQAPLTGLMTSASFQTAENVQDIGAITSYYVQYLAGPNPSGATDTQEATSYDAAWANLYDVMTDLSDLENQSQTVGATAYLGVAKILKAINLGLVVDTWGSVPYEQSFFAETLTPTYDTDAELYGVIGQLLDEGIAALNADESTAAVGDDDFIFGGDTGLWLKTAYLLKARYLNHLSKTAVYNPADVLAAVDLGLSGNQDDAQLTYFEEQINPWASVAIANAGLILDGWLSQQFIDALNGTTFGVTDPRLPLMAGATNAGQYIGTENGAGRGTAAPAGERSVLTTDTWYAARTAPILIATYAEQKFIEAEAAFRTNNRPRAYQAYIAGITAHMNKLEVPVAAQNAYLTNPAVAVGEANLTLDLIFKEKYVAMFLHPEAWVDARRYDYQYRNMTIPANLNPALNGNFIRRLAYPDSETTRNGSNVPDVQLTDRLFWDQP